jgi:hypothetical protein
MRRLKWLAAAVATCAVIAAPSEAQAACGGGTSWNLAGEPASFSEAQPRRGMNCASVRYVVNQWLRPAYENQWSNKIPTRFYDGYVTWHCWKTSRLRWRCEEYSSNTAFRFKAYRF